MFHQYIVSRKYDIQLSIKLFELQLMLVCMLKVCIVAVLTISERGSKYSQVGQYGNMAHIVWRRHQCLDHNRMQCSKIACFDAC